YAAAKVGAILVNINPSYRLRELEYALNQSGVSVLVAAREFRKTSYVEMLVTLIPELTTARGAALSARALPALRHLPYLPSYSAPRGIAWTDFLRNTTRARDP